MIEHDPWESQLKDLAASFSYPPTPDIASAVKPRIIVGRSAAVSGRRAAWTFAITALLLVGLLLVPPVRARLLDVLAMGAVRVFLSQPVAAPLPSVGPIPPQITTTAHPTPLSSILDLEGETTLESARSRVGFPIRLPSYPSGLRTPDKVFVQDFGQPLLIFVWLDDGQTDRVRLSLYQFLPGPFAEKSRPRLIKPSTVNGRPAIWGEGPHLLTTYSGNMVMRRLVDGQVLIWTEGAVTYRLETELPGSEAIRIAESLR
jgi:hypothetical protein